MEKTLLPSNDLGFRRENKRSMHILVMQGEGYEKSQKCGQKSYETVVEMTLKLRC